MLIDDLIISEDLEVFKALEILEQTGVKFF